MKFSFKILGALVVVLCPLAAAAWQLSGVVTDTVNQPIPYVSVFIKNTTHGVATNLKGQFFLELSDGDYSLVIQTIGYLKKEVPCTISGGNKKLRITLKQNVTALAEVNISADREDPAYPIIRNAIASRKKYRTPANSFACNTYIKASLQREFFTHDTLNRKARDTINNKLTKENMNFIETYGMAYYQAPSTWKEVKSAVKDLSESYNPTVVVSIDNGNGESYESDFVNRNLFKAELSEADFNFYYNNLFLESLGPVPFISPLSNMAFLSYKFRLEELFEQDGRWINKIEVIPKRKDAALFAGYIYIVEDLWNIKAVDLTPDKSNLYHFRFFRVLQDYELEGDSSWLLHREEFFYNAKEGKEMILGNTIIMYSDYKLDTVFNKKFFKNELRVTLDGAYEKDSAYWAKRRPVTLKEDEIRFIYTQDSITAVHESAKYMWEQDSIRNRIDIWDILFNGIGFQNSFKKQTIYFTPVIEQMRWLGVGGYRHAIGGDIDKEFSKATKIGLFYELNYGFNNNDMKGLIGGDLLYNPRKFGRIHAEYRNTYELLNEYESIQSIFSRGNYVNELLYSFGHELEIVNGLFLDVTLELGQKKPISGIELSQWSKQVFGDFNQPTDFDPFNEVVMDVYLRYTFGQKYMTAPYKKINIPSRWPTVSLNYIKGLPSILSSTVDFDFIEFKFKDDITVGTIGKSKVRGALGSFVNSKDVRITDYKYFRRSDPYWFSNPLMSFQLLRPDSGAISTNQPYVMLNYVHNFSGTLLNKIPLIKKLHLQAVGGAGILLVDDESNFQHAEIFAGVEWPFRIKRQLMKVGMYYAIAQSNQSELSGEIKFGFDFFNSWTNKWSY